jgi:hypothetical protein
VPTELGRETHHHWMVVAVSDDGSEVVAGVYESMSAAEAAKTVLDQHEADIYS